MATGTAPRSRGTGQGRREMKEGKNQTFLNWNALRSELRAELEREKNLFLEEKL